MTANETRVRLMEAATALLAASPGQRMQTTNLNKSLFYFDLACLRDFGETMTGSAYIALREGPVVAKYEQRLIKPLQQGGLARQERDGAAKPIVLLKRPTRQTLTDDQMELIDQVATWCSDQSATQISEFSHENFGWLMAYDEGLGAKKQAQPIDLCIAMQQLMEYDPWLDEPLDSDTLAALEDADRGEGMEW